MSILITYLKSNGKIVRQSQLPEHAIESRLALLTSDQAAILIEELINIEEYKVEANTLIYLGTKPSEYHVFDHNSNTWVLEEIPLINNHLYKRRELLQESDWTDTISAITRLGQTKYEEWQTYRQALRDITLQSGYPTDIVWPTKPI